jgi:hypothetical protein
MVQGKEGATDVTLTVPKGVQGRGSGTLKLTDGRSMKLDPRFVALTLALIIPLESEVDWLCRENIRRRMKDLTGYLLSPDAITKYVYQINKAWRRMVAQADGEAIPDLIETGRGFGYRIHSQIRLSVIDGTALSSEG